MTSQTLALIVKSIVSQQHQLIGPLAIDQANKVAGLKVTNGGNLEISVTGQDSRQILSQLVQKYEDLFGLASVEVCKDAIRETQIEVSDKELPAILR